MNKTVVVGMSGGVDSAVAAYLLKKEGYNVIGLFMRNWDSTVNGEDYNAGGEICPQEVDYNDAKEVCEKLDIPLKRVDFIKEYWDNVFSYFLSELEKGRTPNPDMLCNRYIKFDLFKKEAKKLGADLIATGHYAKVKDGILLKARDKNKDQTYFLADVKRDEFKDVLFPIGDLTKDEVRKIALDIGIPVAKKKDSTGICFIGERNFQNFIHNFLKKNPGDIINIETGEVIGKHIGLMNYTIGQRRNVGVSGNTERHFVCGKDVKKNILYVCIGNEEYLYSDECTLDNINLLSDKRPIDVTCKFRYRSEEVKATLEYNKDSIRVIYKDRCKSVTPGQACVIYDNDEVIGCGFINEVFKNGEKLWYL